MTVLEALGRRDEPTDEEFVGAVIKMHERIRSQLRAMLRGDAPRPTSVGSVDADIIWGYNVSHGVNPGQITECRRAERRWTVASAR